MLVILGFYVFGVLTWVDPELYSSASVSFVDIVTFTNFCAASTPFQIVSMLNEL